MATPQAGLAAATPRTEQFRLLIGGQTPDTGTWRFAHRIMLAAVLAHLPVAIAYWHLATAPPKVWPVTVAALSAASFLPRLPRRVRSCLMAVAIGLLPVLVYALPHGEGAAAVIMVALFTIIGLFRDWLPWALTVATSTTVVLTGSFLNAERAFGHGHTHPQETVSTLGWHVVLFGGAGAVSLVVMLALTQLRAQESRTRAALQETRRILQAVSHTAAAAETLEEAAQIVLDAVCDETWPVGHLYLVRDGRYFSSDVWSRRSREEHGRVVETTQTLIQGLPMETFKMGAAVAQTRGPGWSSVQAGSPQIGALAEPSVSPRARALADAGIRTVTGSPVLVDDEIVAVIELDSVREFTEEPDEIETVQLIAAFLSGVAERERAARQLRERADLLRILERAVPDAVVLYDLGSQHLIQYIDTDNLLGFTAGDIGRDVTQLAATRDLAGAAEAEPALTAGGGARMTLVPPHRTEPLPVEVYFYPGTLRGRDIGVVLVRDVSVREAAERALTEASARARALLGLADAGIFELDATGRIEYANPQGARLLGREEPEDLVGQVLCDLVPFLREDLQALRDSGPDGQGALVRRPGRISVDGQSIPVSAAVTLLAAADAPHMIVTLADVTVAERAARLASQRSHALEINDTVVQGVSTALYGLEMGEIGVAEEALNQTLASAKQTIATLNSDTAFTPELLRRRQAAQIAAGSEKGTAT